MAYCRPTTKTVKNGYWGNPVGKPITISASSNTTVVKYKFAYLKWQIPMKNDHFSDCESGFLFCKMPFSLICNCSTNSISDQKNERLLPKQPLPALPLLLNRKELSHFTGLSEKKAIEILARHGVQPLDFGRGRGNDLRWRTSAVIEVLDILHNEAQAKRQKSQKVSRRFSVRDKTAAQLFAEFNGNIHTHAEVCDGN